MFEPSLDVLQLTVTMPVNLTNTRNDVADEPNNSQVSKGQSRLFSEYEKRVLAELVRVN